MDLAHRKEAFNLEKEHKIINPHKMDAATIAKTDFQFFTVMPQKSKGHDKKSNNAPFIDASVYKSQYPNWGAAEALVEKTPQYPVYQLPFKGNTLYQENYKS